MRKKRFAASLLLLLPLASACASVPPMTEQMSQIRMFNGAPTGIAFERMESVTAVHGYGCGLFGARGSREGAMALLRVKAVENGADAVELHRWKKGGISNGCNDNRFMIEAALLRLPTFSYTPPVETSEGLEEFRYVVARDFDATWSSLVDVVASTFFEVQNYEKDSGLLTLVYDSDSPFEYIDCGTWKKSYPRGEVAFDGSYVGWLMEGEGIESEAKINLRVKEVGRNRSEVEITALYRVEAPAHDSSFRFKTDTRSKKKLRENKAPGTPDFRTCQATRQLERDLLAEIAGGAIQR